MKPVLVIDACSLINFFKHYYFDKYRDNKIYKALLNFLTTKISSGEILIIDKVFTEFHDGKDNLEFKKTIKNKIINTTGLLNDITRLSEVYYIDENEKYFGNDSNKIDAELQIELDCADLYLIAYCNKLKVQGLTPTLITDETTNINKYRKLIHKIPTICKREAIRYDSVAYMIFEIYKEELKFTLTIKT